MFHAFALATLLISSQPSVPQAGATLHASPGEAFSGWEVRMAPEGGRMRKSWVDSEGSFRFQELEPGRYRALLLDPERGRKGGFLILGGVADVAADANQELELEALVEFERGVRWSARMVHRGVPVPSSSLVIVPRLGEWDRLLDGVWGHLSAVADMKGRFVIDRIPPGPVWAQFIVGGTNGRVRRLEYSVPNEPVYAQDIELPKTSIEGRVLWKSQPVPGARMKFERSGPAGTLSSEGTTLTDAEGRFRFSVFEDGPHTVLAEAPEREDELGELAPTRSVVFDVIAGEIYSSDLELTPGASVHVGLETASGRLESALVLLPETPDRNAPYAGKWWVAPANRSIAGADFRGVPAGKYRAFWALAPAVPSLPFEVRAGERSDIAITVKAEKILRFEVVDEQGESVRALIEVLVTPELAVPLLIYAAGIFPMGKWNLRFSAEGFVEEMREFTVDENTGREPQRIVLRRQ